MRVNKIEQKKTRRNKRNRIGRLWAVTALVLTAALLFGCSGKDGGSKEPEQEEAVETSTYIEGEVNLPPKAGAVLDALVLEDGSLTAVCFDEKAAKGSIWKSADEGKNWEEEGLFTENLSLKKAKDSLRHQAVLSPKGDVFFEEEDWESGKQSCYLISGADKNVQKLKQTDIRIPEFAQDGSLLYQTSGKGRAEIQRLDPKSGQTESLCDLQTDFANALCCEEGNVYVFTNEQCLGFSLDTGKEIEVPQPVQKAAEGVDNSANFENTDPQKFCIVKSGEDGGYTVYTMTNKGIIRYKANEEARLISGSETCLYTNTTSLYSFDVLNEKKFFAAAECDGEQTLFSYTYAPDKVGQKTQLQMYMLTKEPVFDKIIAAYERKNPSVKINLTIGMEENTGAVRSDAVKALNTELLAGKGPDILCLNDMPVEQFINNGILEDLTREIEKADQQETLFANITGCYKKDGKLYAVPTQFSFICVGGSKNVVRAAGSLNHLMDALEAESGRVPALSGDNFNIQVLILYRAFLAEGQKEKQALSEEKLKNFYRQIRRMYDWHQSPKVLDQPEPMKELGLQSLGYPSPLQYVDEEASAQLCFLNEMGDVSVMKELNNQKQVSFRRLGKAGTAMFLPKNIMGISSKSQHKEEAKAFVSYLLSSRGQGYYYGPGFYSPGISVNQEMARTELDNNAGFIVEGLKDEQLSKAEKEQVMQFLSEPSAAADTDSLFRDIVMEHLQSYLKGDKSLEQAAADAMKRLKLYLAEQE